MSSWHPVAWDRALAPGACLAVRLFDRELVVWRDTRGALSALDDRCPHRGTRLSIGRVEADGLACAYHGWRFARDGRCLAMPAHPQLEPQARCNAAAHEVAIDGGAIVVRLAAATPLDDAPLPGLPATARHVLCGPYDVATSAPRVIENFLDLAHLGIVHDGILGTRDDGAIADYRVESSVRGIVATGCRSRQPRAHADSTTPIEVDYTYRVLGPFVAQLEKRSADRRIDTIRLRVQPVRETGSRAFIDMAIHDDATPDDRLAAFQDAIFEQDRPILENQMPQRLPLDPEAERSMPSDRLSVAYRRFLAEHRIAYGTCRGSAGVYIDLTACPTGRSIRT